MFLNANNIEEHRQQLVQLTELQHVTQLLHLRSPVQHRACGSRIHAHQARAVNGNGFAKLGLS
jgi:hypothetical protein